MKAHERGIFKQQGAEDAGSWGSRPSEWRKPRPSPRLPPGRWLEPQPSLFSFLESSIFINKVQSPPVYIPTKTRR